MTSTQLSRIFLLMALASLAAPGCGGDDDGGTAPTTPDAGIDAAPMMAPTSVATITFPPPRSWTNETAMTVRGSTADAEFLRAIRVNGIDASSDDGFVTWQAEVPLELGENTIKLEGEDLFGEIVEQSATAVVERSVLTLESASIELDSANNRVLMVDDVLDAVLAVDLANGARTIVSGLGVGEGPEFESFADNVLDLDNQRLLVVEAESAAIITVDLTDGTRRGFDGGSDDPNGSLAGIARIALDSANGRLLAVNGADQTLIAIDVDTGERSVISGPGQGDGVAIERPRALALDAGRDRALLLQGLSAQALIAIDLDSGDRTVISDEDTGGGEVESFVAYDFIVDADGDRALTIASIDGEAGVPMAIDLDSGARTLVASGEGNGRALDFAASLAFDSAGGRLLVTDDGADTLVAVALDSGDRTVIAESRIGAGPLLNAVADSQPDSEFTRVVAVRSGAISAGPSAIFAIDIATGERTIIADDTRGTGPTLADPLGLALSADDATAYVSDAELEAIVSVDLTTGNREVLSDATEGEGPALTLSLNGKLVLDEENSRLLVADDGADAVISVALDSGDRELISDASKGAGDEFEGVTDVFINAAQVLVLDSRKETLFAIDPATGDRTVISGPDRGQGPSLAVAGSVIVSADGDRAYVATVSELIDVNLTSGDRRLLSQVDGDLGPAVPNRGLTLDAERQRLLGSDIDSGLIVVDAVTGESVIVSH